MHDFYCPINFVLHTDKHVEWYKYYYSGYLNKRKEYCLVKISKFHPLKFLSLS